MTTRYNILILVFALFVFFGCTKKDEKSERCYYENIQTAGWCVYRCKNGELRSFGFPPCKEYVEFVTAEELLRDRSSSWDKFLDLFFK